MALAEGCKAFFESNFEGQVLRGWDGILGFCYGRLGVGSRPKVSRGFSN